MAGVLGSLDSLGYDVVVFCAALVDRGIGVRCLHRWDIHWFSWFVIIIFPNVDVACYTVEIKRKGEREVDGRWKERKSGRDMRHTR